MTKSTTSEKAFYRLVQLITVTWVLFATWCTAKMINKGELTIWGIDFRLTALIILIIFAVGFTIIAIIAPRQHSIKKRKLTPTTPKKTGFDNPPHNLIK